MSQIKLSPRIAEIIGSAKLEGSSIVLTCGQLDRPTYEELKKAIEASGGKWKKKIGGFIFPAPERAQAFKSGGASGAVTNIKQAFQAFYTPSGLADRLVRYAEIFTSDNLSILEPSAGGGAIIDALQRNRTGHAITGIEIDPVSFSALSKKYGDDETVTVSLINADFLQFQPYPAFDRVIMNPPFTKGADMAHCLHARKFLKPGGFITAITSRSWYVGTRKAQLDFQHKVTILEEVDAGEFKESGTGVATLMIRIEAE
jgi:predicted RNA methylase